MNRRRFLTTVTATSIAAVAGCSGDGSGEASTATDSPIPTDSPTPTPKPSSQIRGPTEEDRQYVDVRYRDFTESEVEEAKSSAESVEYRELFRNIESYGGEYVTYDGTIAQQLEGDGYFTFLIGLNHSTQQLVYGTWTGSRFLQGDKVRIWAQVLGTEIYETGAGSENTVPALAIADMEMMETPTEQ